MCRAKVRARTCQFFNKFEKTAALAEPNSISVEEVMDIEDLVKISKLNG